MITIDNTIITDNILQVKFACDLSHCKGFCCIYGDDGAPLEEDELSVIKELYPEIKPYMSTEGIKAIEKTGCFYIDESGEYVTPLVEGKQCAYVYFENDVARCAIEKAYLLGKITFRKPVSCHLYPLRLKKYESYTAVNYHEWDICRKAVDKGKKANIPLYIFLKEALLRKFGKRWYNQLVKLADKELH